MKRFLLLPSWGLFLIFTGTTFGLLLVDQFFFPVEDDYPKKDLYLSFKKLILLSASGLTYYWYWIINRLFSNLLKEKGITTKNHFKWVFVFFCISLIVNSFSNEIIPFHSNPSFLLISGITTGVSIFYLFFNLAYKLRLLENANTGFRQLFKSYDPMMFAFLPIGIWYLQPRIQAILKANTKIK